MGQGLGRICEKHPDLKGLRNLYQGVPTSNCIGCQRDYKQATKVRANELRKARRADNPERLTAELRRHYEKTRHRFIARAKERKKLIGGQSIARRYLDEIAEIYRKRPPGHHVDHVVPLKGNGVCGLHVPWNLQYLPAKANRAKSNRMDE